MMTWGYMGKVPSRGDFIVHNVLPSMRELLFEWCQATMAVSREQLGRGWLEAYLTSPIWHFGASPGAFAETGLIGTLIPSVDRVGRHFPFIVLADYDGTALDAWQRHEWSSALEERVLAVLDDGWSEGPWRQRLATIDLPAVASPQLLWPGGSGNLMLPSGAGGDLWLGALLEQNRKTAIWWSEGSALVEPVTLLTDGLPKVGQFASMLAGQWAKHGWQQGTLTG